jgi:hypothetical protein
VWCITRDNESFGMHIWLGRPANACLAVGLGLASNGLAIVVCGVIAPSMSQRGVSGLLLVPVFLVSLAVCLHGGLQLLLRLTRFEAMVHQHVSARLSRGDCVDSPHEVEGWRPEQGAADDVHGQQSQPVQPGADGDESRYGAAVRV